MRNQQFLRLFECGDGLLPRDGWEIVEEVGKRMAALEIVNQGLHRHPCPDEYGRAAKNLGVGVDDLLRVVHVQMIAPVVEGA